MERHKLIYEIYDRDNNKPFIYHRKYDYHYFDYIKYLDLNHSNVYTNKYGIQLRIINK